MQPTCTLLCLLCPCCATINLTRGRKKKEKQKPEWIYIYIKSNNYFTHFNMPKFWSFQRLNDTKNILHTHMHKLFSWEFTQTSQNFELICTVVALIGLYFLNYGFAFNSFFWRTFFQDYISCPSPHNDTPKPESQAITCLWVFICSLVLISKLPLSLNDKHKLQFYFLNCNIWGGCYLLAKGQLVSKIMPHVTITTHVLCVKSFVQVTVSWQVLHGRQGSPSWYVGVAAEG